MAKTQRWRRNRRAESDLTAPDTTATSSPTAAEEVDPTEPAADPAATEPEGGPVEDVAPEPDAEPDTDAEPGEPEVEPRTEDDVAPTAPLVAAETDEAAETDDAPDAEAPDQAAVEAPAVRPPLPHVPERSGITGKLFGRTASDVVALQLLQAAHAKQAITMALALGLVAALTGRPAREAGVVVLTVLVGQTILGWHNDLVDRERDRAHGLTGKPLAMGRLEAGTVWYAIVVALLLLIPLGFTTGIRAGCFYFASVAIGVLGNVVLRTGFFSWWSWAASYALLPAYLSYGGWGGQAVGSPPEPAIVALAAALGVGVHFMRSAWGLVADHEDGWTYLPLKLGLKLGATRLLALSTVYTAGVVIALAVVGSQVGLSQ